MSDEKSKLKPGDRDASATEPARLVSNNTGRVKFDDRGNAVWEWAVTTGSFATDVSTARLKKLENQTLSLADESPIPPVDRIVKPNPKGVVQGYSPYDSGLLAKTGRAAKKKDLRRLGEFMKLREQATRNKQDK